MFYFLEIYLVSVLRKILNKINVFMVYELVKWSELDTKFQELFLLNVVVRIFQLVSRFNVYGLLI